VIVDDRPTDELQSRRNVLKRIAVGGAVAWSAPVLLSSAAAAATESPVPTTTSTTTEPLPCTSGQWQCGDPIVLCGSAGLDGICVCDVDVHGADFCFGNFPCGDPRAVACTANSDCPTGWACVTSCCGQTCAPPCDGTFGAGFRIQGATAVAA